MSKYRIRVEDPVIYSKEMRKVQHKCKCGHTVTIPDFAEKNLCSYCGTYVFKNKKDEFSYRMKEQLIKGK
jgi:hypothetical protein